jgi:hypothetical protein
MNFAKKTTCLVINLILFSACGEFHQEEVEIAPEFEAHVLDFQLRTGIKTKVKMVFNPIEKEDVIAYCYNYNNVKKNYIEVDPEAYESLSDAEKEEVIYHELGHCVLNRRHDETIYNRSSYPYLPVSSLYKSIMYPYVFGRLYSRFKDYYVEELTDPNVSLLKHFQ